MELKEMIKVMKHFENGGTLEVCWKGEDETEWSLTNNPSWDWFNFDYRIYQPKPKPEKIKIEKWLIQEPYSKVYCVVEISDIDKYLKQYNHIKVKLLESYEVEKE